MKRLVLACLVFGFSGAATADTITFEADGGVTIIRWYDTFGMTTAEFIGEPGAMYQCIALGTDDRPLGTTVAMADVGQMTYQDLDPDRIARISCRKTM